MKEYTKTNPVYSPKIKVVETTDPAHADNVNAAPKQLLENTMANRQSIERLEATTGIAEGDYNAGNAYHTGDFCLYDNNLYKCIKDTTGAWDAGSWKATSPLEEIESLRKSLDALDTLMGGATQSKEGTAGLVPAPAAGAQGKYLKGDGTWGTPPDTVYTHPTTAGNNHIPAGGAVGKFLKWLSNGVAQWASLGAAAMYNVSNNDTTTEEGFLADARRVKALRDDVDALNSALGTGIPAGAYVYVLKSSTTSFKDAAGTTVVNSLPGTLDILHSSISNYDAGMINVFNTNQNYPVMLDKLGDNYYFGIIGKYSPAENYPMFFARSGNLRSLFMPQKIG